MKEIDRIRRRAALVRSVRKEAEYRAAENRQSKVGEASALCVTAFTVYVGKRLRLAGPKQWQPVWRVCTWEEIRGGVCHRAEINLTKGGTFTYAHGGRTFRTEELPDHVLEEIATAWSVRV